MKPAQDLVALNNARIENDTLRAQLEEAEKALFVVKHSLLPHDLDCTIDTVGCDCIVGKVRKAIADYDKPVGAFQKAEGLVPWKEGDELPEDVIRRARGHAEARDAVVEAAQQVFSRRVHQFIQGGALPDLPGFRYDLKILRDKLEALDEQEILQRTWIVRRNYPKPQGPANPGLFCFRRNI